MTEGGPKMLRMVRWQGIIQDAERLRNWRDVDPFEALSRMVHMGDPRTATDGLLTWVDQELTKLESNPATVPSEYDKLEALYLEMLSKVNGRLSVMDTELGYYSQNVGPEFDKAVYEYPTWANSGNLRNLFSEGKECTVTGHMGTGKSHLAVLFMESLLTVLKRPTVHIVTNISGVKDTSGQFNDRIHHVTLLSQIFSIWARLPENCLIVLFIDEPESNLRGGSTKSVKLFSDFRHMIRKLGMSKLEIWHNEAEQYKALREENSDNVTRIFKNEKEAFEVHRKFRGDGFKQRVEGVHELKFLKYAHRGMASITVDVNMPRLIHRLSSLTQTGEMKDAIRTSLGSAYYYVDEYKPRHDDDAITDEWEKVIEHVLRDVRPYLTQKRHMDRHLLRQEFDLTDRVARRVAAEATKRWREANPNWRTVEPEPGQGHEGAGHGRPPRPRRGAADEQEGGGDEEE